MTSIHWLPLPEEHDYPAAVSYLSLLMEAECAEKIVRHLRGVPVSEFKAKDIFRASGVSLLGVSNLHVEKNHKKINSGTPLSPLLLTRVDGRLIIADGYHRLCAVYSYNEDALIPVKII